MFNARDKHHGWCRSCAPPLPRPWIVCRAALIETTHYFRHNPQVLDEMIGQTPDFIIDDPDPVEALRLMRRYAPAMDHADACAVLLAKAHKGVVVVTTDHRDFATYRIPFISPKGAFYTWPGSRPK